MPKNSSMEDKSGNSVEKILDLYRFMKEQNLEELELKDMPFHVRIRRKSRKPKQQQIFFHSGSLPLQPATAAEPKNIERIKAPLNGIFYRAASPSSPPFVSDGDVAEIGTVLCIIEAMKVMNDIKSEIRCKILRILVENGQQVSANQEIFVVQKI